MTELSHDDYLELMALNGRPVYALRVGGQGASMSGNFTWPTVWPERENVTELALEQALGLVRCDIARCHGNGYTYSHTHLDRTFLLACRLLNATLDETIARLKAEGYGAEKTQAGDLNVLKVSWPEGFEHPVRGNDAG